MVTIIIDKFIKSKTFDIHVDIDGEIEAYYTVQGLKTVEELADELPLIIKNVQNNRNALVTDILTIEYNE